MRYPRITVVHALEQLESLMVTDPRSFELPLYRTVANARKHRRIYRSDQIVDPCAAPLMRFQKQGFHFDHVRRRCRAIEIERPDCIQCCRHRAAREGDTHLWM